MEKYYKILGITSTATKEEIKQAYLAKMKTLHPDKVHGTNLEDTANFFSTELNEAYEFLMAHYDDGKLSNNNYNGYSENNLWNGACYGMSLTDIKKIFPNGFIPAKLDTYDDGARALFKIEEFELVNNIFEVSFIFRVEKLVRVQLNHKSHTNKFQSHKVYNSLKQALTEKYGKGIITNNDSYHDCTNLGIEWLSSSGVNISLSLLIAGSNTVGHFTNVNITYSIRRLSDEINIQDELGKL